MSRLRLYQLPLSPNNVKVRLALGFKGLEWESVEVPFSPGDDSGRAEVLRISGQPLVPVLVDGEKVIFDSHAILRYLDANFRDTPRLFAEDRPTLQAIEEWELWGRTTAPQPVGILFRAFLEGRAEEVKEQARAALGPVIERLETALQDADWLVDGRFSAAEAVIAPWVAHTVLSEEQVAGKDLLRVFREVLDPGPAPRVRDWVARCMAFDRPNLAPSAGAGSGAER